MTFQQFLNNIFSIVPYFFNWFIQVINSLTSNYIVKILIYFIIFDIIIFLFIYFINEIKNFFNKEENEE